LWALWPVLTFGFARPAAAGGDAAPGGTGVLRRRISWFLMLAGSGGVAMHLLSFSIGYYLPPYLIPLFMGLYLAMLDANPHDVTRLPRHRAVWIVAGGFCAAAILSTASHLRRSDSAERIAAMSDTNALSAALAALPPAEAGRRRVAVAGPWLGLYAVRLSNSQVTADIRDPGVLHDPARAARAVAALRDRGVVAILCPRSQLQPGDPLAWRMVDSVWALADIREQAAAPASGGQP
jgi:hypothetical protein